jgi:hypothetical protein
LESITTELWRDALGNNPPKTYKLLKNIAQPDPVKDLTLAGLTNILSSHLSSKPKALAQRCRFHKCQQQAGQPLADFVASLRSIPENCKFEDELESRLRDQFVCNLRNESIVMRLLCEPDTRSKPLSIFFLCP